MCRYERIDRQGAARRPTAANPRLATSSSSSTATTSAGVGNRPPGWPRTINSKAESLATSLRALRYALRTPLWSSALGSSVTRPTGPESSFSPRARPVPKCFAAASGPRSGKCHIDRRKQSRTVCFSRSHLDRTSVETLRLRRYARCCCWSRTRSGPQTLLADHALRSRFLLACQTFPSAQPWGCNRARSLPVALRLLRRRCSADSYAE